MIFTAVKLAGAFVVDMEKHEDERGFYARAWCKKEFERQGILADFVQANISFSHLQGTLRGLHYQHSPHQEAKLFRCVHGAIFSVIVDLRQDSPTKAQWYGVELSAANRRMLFMPEGFASGFISLLDNTEIFYCVTRGYHPESERGVRYDDPAFGIDWPVPVRTISEKDMNWPAFRGGRLKAGGAT